ncbi:corticotropin-releasing factor-binding protein [Macrosteles quadrilineatus]|uniref:corticotropin-releasing factor-binding protein n=1 Tax=Macrosteles quadrilineatus TaxID=74068 RepID=UPI0023E10801|nr:corticotropin-releasing factor-binding protein [Macrosteles quadrilineatus]
MLSWWTPLLAAAVSVVVVLSLSPNNNQIRRASALPLRAKRSIEHIIQDCVMVTSEEGHFYYKSPGGEEVTACGVFLITDPDKVVEVYFDHLDVPCNTGGLVSFVDGWEMNGQFFPSADDHPKPMSERYQEFCGSRQPKTVFLSSQNAGLVQYKVPKRGRGFSFHVRYIRNPTPCNILIEGTSDVYTLRNYGKHVNCSLTAVYPAQVRVLQLGVGMAFSKRNLQVETGTIHKCDKRGMPDFVQLGGSEGLDLSTYSVIDSICGTDSLPERVVETILCGVTTVRLVSSGEFDNAVTIQLRQADEEDIPSASLICGL